MHTYKKGDIVTVFCMSWNREIIVEGKARILRTLNTDERYQVQFLDQKGKPVLGEKYERFVDPNGQADPVAYLADLNAPRAAAQ